jgi:hypothetical protein
MCISEPLILQWQSPIFIRNVFIPSRSQRPRAWIVFVRSNTEILGSNPTGGMSVYCAFMLSFVYGLIPRPRSLKTFQRINSENISCAVCRLFSVHSYYDWWMGDWIKPGKERPWPGGEFLCQNLPQRNQDSRRIINIAGIRSQLLPNTSL